MFLPSREESGFTLVELMISIGLIGVLAVILNTALNPSQILKKSRDAVRISDLVNLRKAIEVAISDGKMFDSRCRPSSPCDSLSGTRSVNGSGYVNIDLSKYLTALPIDPLFGAGTFVDGKGNIVPAYYQFATDGTDFEIRSHLEAKANTDHNVGEDRYVTDGGCNNLWYEVGTNLCLMN